MSDLVLQHLQSPSSATPLHTVTAAHTRSCLIFLIEHPAPNSGGSWRLWETLPVIRNSFDLLENLIFLPNCACLHLSSVLCLVSSFSDQQPSLFLRLAWFSAGSSLPSPASDEFGNHTLKPTLLEITFSHMMGDFFCHGGEEWGKMIYTWASFHRVFCIIAKLFPNPPSPSPYPAQGLHIQDPLSWWSHGGNLWNVARINVGWQLINGHCSVPCHPL